jgi:hypothetical protein
VVSSEARSVCYLRDMDDANHVDIRAFRSERVIITVETNGRRHKILQVFFGRDRSLFVNFPYFQHRTGVLAAATIPGKGQTISEVDLAVGGKVASHLVKYSHHPDGRAHFSQDGKVRTEIRRQSIRLDDQWGHIFSAVFQGLAAFDEADPVTDIGASPKRTTLTFTFPTVPEAFKIIGRWFNSSKLLLHGKVPSPIGPTITSMLPDGRQQAGFLVAGPHQNAQQVLLLTCESIPSLGRKPEVLVFYGGFDPREIMDDTTKEAGFLSFIYPADAEILRHTIGTIDFVERPART